MVKDWIWPALRTLLKASFALAVLTGVWFASAIYNQKLYRESADAGIRVRVRPECLRPDYVKTEMAAQRFDLVEAELDLVRDKLAFTNRRMEKLIEEVERVDALRMEATRGKVRTGGIGGPAPASR